MILGDHKLSDATGHWDKVQKHIESIFRRNLPNYISKYYPKKGTDKNWDEKLQIINLLVNYGITGGSLESFTAEEKVKFCAADAILLILDGAKLTSGQGDQVQRKIEAIYNDP